MNLPTARIHPLKVQLKAHKLRLWQVKELLGGKPTEGQISRILNGHCAMPPEMQARLEEIIQDLNGSR